VLGSHFWPLEGSCGALRRAGCCSAGCSTVLGGEVKTSIEMELLREFLWLGCESPGWEQGRAIGLMCFWLPQGCGFV